MSAPDAGDEGAVGLRLPSLAEPMDPADEVVDLPVADGDGEPAEAPDGAEVKAVGTGPSGELWVRPGSGDPADGSGDGGGSSVPPAEPSPTAPASPSVPASPTAVASPAAWMRTDAGESGQSTISYAPLVGRFGADWASRAQVVAYPACFWVRPNDPVCAQGEVVASVNDEARRTLTFATTASVVAGGGSAGMSGLAGPSAGGGSVYVVAAGVSGSNGNYGANPVAGSSSWQVGTGTGEFSYAYPFALPAAVAGAAPELGLSYSSGSVDGMTVAENGQPGMAGLGWDLGSSFITRSFVPCAQDSRQRVWRTKGDLCWKSDKKGRPVQRLSIVLAGRSTALVRVGTGNQYRLLDDPGWTVTRVVGRTGSAAKSPDNDAERFVVRTPDGTQYRFGFRASARSTWVVPVFANNGKEPCHRASRAASWCEQAWRWNLDRVIDKDGNRTDYTYARESNYYNRYANRSTAYRTRYDRGGYLTKISYGLPVRGGTPRAEVVMSTAARCTPALKDPTHACTGSEGPRAKPSIWPDVPTDLICGKTGGCANASPGFFSTRRYDRLSTRVRRVSTASGGAAGLFTADVYRFTFRMPDPDGPTGRDKPGLWLEQINRTGYGTGGVSTSLPGVNFDGVWLRNRVALKPGQLPFRKLRIASVRNETGGRVQVVYGHQDGRACTPAYVAGLKQWTSTRECFPAKFARPKGTPQLQWWHKYVVKRVAASDDAMGYRLGSSTGGPLAKLRVTDYEYAGAPGWRYVNDPLSTPADRTWSDWRGYGSTITHVRKVTSTRVTAADVVRTRTLVYRGLHHTRANRKGDPRLTYAASSEPGTGRLPDWPWLAGRVYETDTLDPATGAKLARDYTAYASLVTAAPVAGSLPASVGGYGKSAAQARYTYTSRSIARPHLRGSRLQHTVDTVIDRGGRTHRGILLGQVTRTIDYGSSRAARPAISPTRGDQSADNTCTTARYAFNAGTRLVVARESRTRNGCGGTLLARTQTLYDGRSTVSKSVTRGRATRISAWATSTSRIDTDYRYDARGRQTGVSAPHAPDASPVWTTTTFNPGGNTWDPTTWVKTTPPAPKAGGSSLSAQTRLDLRHGYPTSTTDVNGNTTNVTIDGLARVTSVSYPGHPAGLPNVRYAYAVSTKKPSRVVTRTLRDAKRDGSAQAWDTSTSFADGWGRVLETHTPRVNSPNWPIVSATGYDEAGRAYLSMPGFIAPATPGTGFKANTADGSVQLANGDPTSVTQAVVTGFDAMSRPTSVSHRSKGATLWRDTTVYAGDTTTSRGAGLVLAKTTADVFGRALTSSQYASAAVTSAGQPVTAADTTATYAYSPTGQLAGITSGLPGAPGGQARYRYSYDWLGRRTSASDPDTGTTSTSYDSASNPVKVIDAANAAIGIAVQTSYDRWNRPVKRQQTGTGGTKTLATWSYDTAVNGRARPSTQTSYTPLGVFTSKVDAYDPRGQVTRSTQTYPAVLTGEAAGGVASKTSTVAYNQAGMVTARVFPAIPGTVRNSGPLTQTYRYTTGGRVSGIDSVTTGANIPLGMATYDKWNRPAELVSGNTDLNELERRYRFNPATGDLTGISASNHNGTQLALAYSYDGAGRPIKITGTQPADPNNDPNTPNGSPVSATWCYRYDATNRLTRATTGASGSVSGNGSGNTATCTGSPNTSVTGANYDLTYSFDHSRLAVATDHRTGAKATYQHTTPAHPHAVTSTATTGAPGAVGNGLLPASGALTYDPAARAVTSTVTNPTTHEAGAGSGSGDTRTTYDALGNPIRIAPLSGTGPTTIQAFDADGLRIARQDRTPSGKGGATTTTTVFLDGYDITHQTGQTGTAARVAVRHFATPAGTPIATRDDLTATNFTFLDAQGTVRLVQQNIAPTVTGPVSTHAYTPYGNPITTHVKYTAIPGANTGPPGQPGPGMSDNPGDRGYLNHTHDPNGDLRLDHRNYTPTLGTLTTPDPLLDLADPQNLNPYSYAANNPITFADPSGLKNSCIDLGTCTSEPTQGGPPIPTGPSASLLAEQAAYQQTKAMHAQALAEIGATHNISGRDLEIAFAQQAAQYVPPPQGGIGDMLAGAAVTVSGAGDLHWSCLLTGKLCPSDMTRNAVRKLGANTDSSMYQGGQLLAVYATLATPVAEVGAAADAELALTSVAAEARVASTASGTADGLPKVNWGQQSKHFPGHPNYMPGRSQLTANPELLIQRAGSGSPVGPIPRGEAGFKERIDFGDSIGTYVARDGTSSSTSVGILHYRADGSVHIVPGRPS